MQRVDAHPPHPMTAAPLDRPQTFGEEVANALSHGIGALLALFGLPVLVYAATVRGGAADVVGATLFGVTMIVLYLASTLYHALPAGAAKRWFNRFDHAAIYLFIAGSYMPFLFGVLWGGWGWSLFGVLVAAAVLGEGMSSPLMDQVREQRGLAYYTACSADVLDICGQFVIEASTAPDKLDEFLRVATQLLRQHAERVDPVDLDRARHQLAVRCARDHDRPMRRLEDAAMEVFVHGRLRAPTAWLARLQAVTADEVSAVFQRMLHATPSLAVTGKLGRATSEHLRDAVAAALA